MAEQEVRLYPYRWVVLAAFMLINVMVQVLWICYVPVATIARILLWRGPPGR